MNEQAADRGAGRPIWGDTEIVRDRGRGLPGGGDAVDVGGLDPASAIALSAASACKHDLRHAGRIPSSVVSAAPTIATVLRFYLTPPPA